MRKLYKFLLSSAILLPTAVFGQDVTYTFDTGGNGANTSGTTYTNLAPYGATVAADFSTGTLTSYGLASSLGNATNVFRGISWTGTNMGGVDLTAFTATGDQQVDWTMYIKSATTASKGNGVVLRAQNTVSGYSTGVRQGYHFTCYGSGTSGSIMFRVGKLDGNGSYINLIPATTVPITGFTQGPLYLRAKAVGSLLFFQYSTDATNYVYFPGSPYHDTTFPTATSTSGTVQLVWGLGGGTMDHYYDDVILSSQLVTLSGTKFSYSGSSQSPTITTSGFTSPTETKTYTGIGGTPYGPSTTAPSAPGTYILTASETENSVTKSATISFDILPSTFDQVYNFNSETPGLTAANTTCVTLALNYKHLVQRSASQVMIGSTFYPTNSTMLSPNGSDPKALTTLNNFGSSATDYSVTWKMYFTNTGGNKNLVFLRANGISLNGTNLLGGTGYEFYIQMQTGTSAVNAYIYKLASGGAYANGTLLGSNTSTLAQSQNYQNRAMWFRASAIGSSSVAVKLEYSTDGSTWYTLCSGTDATSPYTSGSTQITGINNNGTNYFFDYFGYTDLTKNVTANDNKFVYSGSAVSPTVSYPGFSSPSTTLTYTGTGGTSYSARSTAPTAVGTYSLSVSASEGGVTRTGTFAFEIVPSNYDNLYTFKSDVVGNNPANIVYKQGATSGVGVVSMYAGNDNGSSATAITFKPTAAGSLNGTGVADLTSIASSSNYSVTWKEYISATGSKKGYLLQGQSGTSAYANDLKQGYLFIVYNDATNGTFLRIYKTDASGVGFPVANANNTISNPAVGSARWYRATVAHGLQKFEYSDNGTTWVTGTTWNDMSYAGLSGTTQAVYGLGAGVGTYYYDYIASTGLASTFSKEGSSNWSTATEWSKTPTSTNDLIIASGELIFDQNATVQSITIKPGARLTLNNGVSLATTSALTIQCNASGNGTFLDLNAEGGLTMGRTPMVQQYMTGSNTTGVPSGRFWYMTSPIKGATLAKSGTFTASGANKLWSYNEAGGATLTEVYTEITDDVTSLTAGKGYVVRLADPTTVSFTGTGLVTGTTNVPFTYTSATGKPGFNLVGNPYPSYLNIASALASASDLETSIWCRSHNSTSNAMVFDTYNSTSKTSVINSGAANLTDYVPPMQAIWVKAKTTSGNLALTNAMRSHQPSGNLLRSADANKIIRLKVSSGLYTDQAVITFNSDAIDAFDNFDSRKMFNGIDSLPEIYTLAGTLPVAINGMAPFEVNKELALGFKTAKAGTFTIKVNDILNLDKDQTVVLKDKLLNVSQNLIILTEYNFTSEATTTTDRFSVIIGKSASGLDVKHHSNFQVRGLKSGQIEINMDGDQSTKVEVYDMLGKMIHSENMESQSSILNKSFGGGLYMVKINGGMRKVIIND